MSWREVICNPRKRWQLVVVAMVFGAIGGYWLQSSRAAAPETSTAPLLSLAPANFHLTKGGVVNVAVNVGAAAGHDKRVSVVLHYPASVQLQAVRDLCPAPAFAEPHQDMATAGSVAVSCKQSAAAPAGTAMAELVFLGMDDSGMADITIASDSQVTDLASKGMLKGTLAGSRMVLAPVRDSKQGAVVQKTLSRQPTKALCATVAATGTKCALEELETNPGTVPSSDSTTPGTTTGHENYVFHTAYEVPCTPGGPVANVCAAPASFGPQTVGIIVEKNYSSDVAGVEADLAFYDQFYGIPACTVANGCLTFTNSSGGSTLLPANAKDSGWDREIMQDITTVHTMCQTCKILVVEGGGSYDEARANDYAARQPDVVATTMSATITDDPQFRPYDKYYHHPGIAQFGITGDKGATADGQDLWPADIPEVITVGGTTLRINSDNTYAGEDLWSGSGGGCSTIFDTPAWQTALSNWPAVGCNKRASADISIVGDPNTGLYVRYQGAWHVYGGTSLGAPMLAAMFAMANKKPASSTIGASIPYNYSNSTNTHDITTGSNCTAKVTVHCHPGPGFDIPTGLGTPRGLGVFGGPLPAPTPKTGDLNQDNAVNLSDLSMLLSRYGTTDSVADLNKNGKVDLADLSILLSNFGR